MQGCRLRFSKGFLLVYYYYTRNSQKCRMYRCQMTANNDAGDQVKPSIASVTTNHIIPQIFPPPLHLFPGVLFPFILALPRPISLGESYADFSRP